MKTVDPWTCPTCAAPVATPFCATCGEQPMRARHLTLRDLAYQAAEAVSSVDSKLLRSLRGLILRPGSLTVAYVKGARKPYVRPLPLFLAANAVFFAVQSVSRTNVFASTLTSHLTNQDWSAVARTLVDHRLAAKPTTLAAYEPLFNQAAMLNAKTLIILMVLAFSILPPIVFFRARRPLAAHVVFSLHLYAFLLLQFCLCLGIAAIDHLFGGKGLEAPWMDMGLSVFNLVVCAIYLHLAIGRVYAAAGWVRVVETAVLTATVGGLVLGYRFLILLITLSTT